MSAIFRSAVTAVGIVITTPVLAWTVYPDVDFEWYANVGSHAAYVDNTMPAPRPGFIWIAGEYETRAGRLVWVGPRWIKDDYYDQLAIYNKPIYASAK